MCPGMTVAYRQQQQQQQQQQQEQRKTELRTDYTDYHYHPFSDVSIFCQVTPALLTFQLLQVVTLLYTRLLFTAVSNNNKTQLTMYVMPSSVPASHG